MGGFYFREKEKVCTDTLVPSVGGEGVEWVRKGLMKGNK